VILFIHGFNSSSECTKCQLLQAMTAKAIIPSLDLLDIAQTLSHLESIMAKGIEMIVGASFGGFYAQYLAKKYHKPLLLINPVMQPLDLIETIDLQGYDPKKLIEELRPIIAYSQSHTFDNELELLVGLNDTIIDPKGHAELFKAFACKYYQDDHYLAKGFSGYLGQTGTLLEKYL
jgi:predicted esterase YcpF (UPF0227 family)